MTRTRNRPLSALAFTLALAAGCRGCGPAGSPPPAATSSPAAQGLQSAPEPPALSAEALAPVIREKGLPGVLPDAVVIELAREAAPPDLLGKASPKSAIAFAPEAKGILVWEGASTLVFRPERPLEHGTTYRVALRAVESRAGILDAPAGGWDHEFTTPPFGLARLALEKLDGAARAEVRLVFSGAVKASDVAPFAEWTLDGERLDGVRLSGTEQRNALRAAIQGRRLRPGATVALALRAGAPEAGRKGTTAPAAQATVVVPGGPAVEIRSVALREGTAGFYLDVVCHDGAVRETRGYYDREAQAFHQRLSRRCQLGDDEVAAIHVTPPTRVRVAPGAGGFRIFGDFPRGPLALAIDAGARTRDGGALHEAFERSFSVPARSPRLSLASGGRYLPRSAWKSLPVSHLNVSEARLSIRRVPPENLVHWLAQPSEAAGPQVSDLLARRTTPLRGKPDTLTTTWLEVGSMLPADTKGVLELTVEEGRARATARLLLTDLNLVAKRSVDPAARWRQTVHVWALDMRSTEPLSGVEVQLVRQSGAVLGRCSTSGEAGCRIEPSRADVDDAEPFALLARKGDDLTYIRWSDLRTDTSESDVAGEPWTGERAYRASAWTDRGVYRPGDVVHLAAVLRDRGNVAPPAGMPVEVRLLDPRQKVARKVMARTNEAGMLAVDLPFGAYAETGRHEAQLLVADQRIAGHAFAVEEFVPERMKVEAAADRPAYLLGEPVAVAVGARYLFGGSAQGSGVEITCAVEPAPFRPARENAQLAFGPRPRGAAKRPLTLGSAAGTLDAAGRATVGCPAAPGAFDGPGRLTVQAAVFEAGSGRSSVAQATAQVHPERYYLGLESGARRAEARTPLTVKGAVVDWSGALLPSAVREVEVELVRLEPEWGWWWDGEEGGERWERHLRPVPEGARKVAVAGGRFSVELTPEGGGASYLVRARSGRALSELELEGDRGGWDWEGGPADRAETPKPLRPASLALDVPARVRVGEAAAVKLRVPFRGRALLTLETDRVLHHEWRKVEPGELSWRFAVKAFAPNVYASVLLVKDPHLESAQAFLPERAFGVASVEVAPEAFTADLKLGAPAEVRSRSQLTVTLDVGKTEGPTFAAVAAVDEGILQLTRMRSPDPLRDVFARRALGVDTFETIGWTLLLPPQGPSRSTGGDAGSPAGRVQPVKPVALWSGLVPVSAEGKATVTFALPQYRGRLRVMAVTAGPRRMGRADALVTVKDPLVLSSTLPRFATSGDVLQIPVFVTNLSGGPQEVQVDLAAEPLPVPGMAPPAAAERPLVLLGRPSGTLRLADGASGTLVFRARAAVAAGAAKLRVRARAGPFESREELDVPFLPAGPRERRVERIELAESSVDLVPRLRGWVPTSERTTFWLTANPYGETFDHLKHLIHYPYGCVEQTTSSARPLLFAASLVDSIDPALTAGGKLEDMVMAGVSRLLSMQTPGGGLAYWPGGTEPYGWGTAYATHFLLDAQKLGYPVPQDRLEEILRWIEAETAALERGQRRRWEAPGAEAYLHYVLALAGKGHKARLLRLVEQLPAKRDGEAAERAYMLQAALWLAGDRRFEQELRHPDVGPVSDERRNDWSFYSDRRRRGFLLSTFQDLFGDDPAGEELASRVAEALRRPSHWYTTQELVWGVTGLGKRVGDAARDFAPGRLLANGKAVEPRPPRGRRSDRTWALARASEVRDLRLQIDDRGSGRLFLVVASEGVREKPDVRHGGSGLSLTRTWRQLDGTELDPRQRATPLAGLAFVELTIRNTSGERIQNVALVDRIPAGFEIENPRLGRGTPLSWLDADAQWQADYLDVRDDRIAVFGALEPGQSRKVTYAVRAVTAGTFTQPPAEAEAMYDPRLWARAEGGTVEVASPWKNELL